MNNALGGGLLGSIVSRFMDGMLYDNLRRLRALDNRLLYGALSEYGLTCDSAVLDFS
jgi:hypothetical protein